MIRKPSLYTLICCALCCGCGDTTANRQVVDLSSFNRFTFSRTIDIDGCFDSGDLLSAELISQADGRLLNFTMLAPSEDEQTPCLATTPEGLCLMESAPQTRMLVDSEGQRIDTLFRRIEIANQPDVLCGAGNITLCSADEYNWDGLTLSNDFCQGVHVANAYELMGLMQTLRDGPTPDSPTPAGGLDLSSLTPTPLEVVEVLPVVASDQILGKNGDYAVIRSQSDLDGALFQDGSASIDFQQHIGVVVIIIRGPCEEYTNIQAVDTLLTVDVSGNLQRDDGCSFDLGSIDAYLIVIPSTLKKVRLFLNNSELDEISL